MLRISQMIVSCFDLQSVWYRKNRT